MNKLIFLLTTTIFVIYFIGCIDGFNTNSYSVNADLSGSEPVERGIKKKIKHGLYSVFGLHALAIAFWIKVKLVIVAFIVGSAFFLGLRYLLPKHSCPHEVISYDHGPAYTHDHIPYSLGHSEQETHSIESSPENDPYRAYSGYYADIPSTSDSKPHHINRRSLKRQLETEEQISEFMFSFLGLNSEVCRRRFICEMEFRSNDNSLTRMAFRIVGRGLFEKYLNSNNEKRSATSFSECALANSDCTVIEEDTNNANGETLEITEPSIKDVKGEDSNIVNVTHLSDFSAEEPLERENIVNIKVEREETKLPRHHYRKSHGWKPIAATIFSRTQK